MNPILNKVNGFVTILLMDYCTTCLWEHPKESRKRKAVPQKGEE